MKIVVKLAWFIVLLASLALLLTAFIDNGAALNVSKTSAVAPISMIGQNDSVSYVASPPGIYYGIIHPRQDIEGDKLVLGGTFTLAQGETLEGNLFVVGGTAALEEDSIVEQDVVVMGGTLSVEGKIEGNVALIGGLVTLNEGAVVEGDVNALGGNLLQDEGARVEGKINTDIPGTFPLVLPGRIQLPDLGAWSLIRPGDLRLPSFDIALNPFWDGLWLLFRSFLWAAMAVLVVLFLPKHSERAAGAVVSQPLVAGGLGCITAIIAPLVLALLAITICGIPISVIGAVILIIAWVFGIIVVGMEVGKRLAQLVKQDWAMPVSASIGTFILTLVINSIGTLVSCIGWLAPALVGMVGLGAVLLTRFGAQNYSPEFHPLSETAIESQSSDLAMSQLSPENQSDSLPEEILENPSDSIPEEKPESKIEDKPKRKTRNNPKRKTEENL